MKPFVKISNRDYPYIVVDVVRVSPPVGHGMRSCLAYVDMTVDEALEFVKTNHPDQRITGVTQYV